MAPDGPRLKFTASEEAELAEYRRPSVQAILALILGVLSPTALIHPMYWIVPVVAAAIALIALRRIATSDGQLTGRGIALVALLLAMLFGAWAPSRLFSRQATLYREARQYSQAWLDLVLAGRLYEAYELHLQSASRHPPGTDFEKIYGEFNLPLEAPVNTPLGGFPSTEQPREALRHFFSMPPLDRVVAIGSRGKARFDSNDQLHHDERSQSDLILQTYSITYDDNGENQGFQIVVAMRRVAAGDSTDALWHVENVSRPGE